MSQTEVFMWEQLAHFALNLTTGAAMFVVMLILCAYLAHTKQEGHHIKRDALPAPEKAKRVQVTREKDMRVLEAPTKEVKWK